MIKFLRFVKQFDRGSLAEESQSWYCLLGGNADSTVSEESHFTGNFSQDNMVINFPLIRSKMKGDAITTDYGYFTRIRKRER